MKIRILWLFLIAFSGALSAEDQVRFQLKVKEPNVNRGDQIKAILVAQLQKGWHLYSMTQPPGGPIPTTISVAEDSVFRQSGKVEQPPPHKWFDPNFGINTEYFEGKIDFQIPIEVKADAPAGEHDLSVKVRFQLCSDRLCLAPQRRTFTVALKVTAPPSVEPINDGSKSGPAGSTAPREGAGDSERPPAQTGGDLKSAGETPGEMAGQDFPIAAGQRAPALPLLAYIWLAMGMGGLALLTPCVFPMIPITVSYFTKRDTSRRKALTDAGLYAVGIILTFTLVGFTLTFLFGAGGINRLAASPMVNLFIALVFVIFALSLFGVVELRLPSTWITALDRKTTSAGGILGILLMAFTFSLVSFTCTVPFVGTVMVAALYGDVLWSLLGVTAFATVFAAPFFVLALFPTWLQSLPKSGNWMNSVKITMGFLELAAALKFISNIDLVYQWEIVTRPVFITVWLSIALMTAFYLLGKIRFPHETQTETLGAVRVLSAIVFLAVSFYLLRGLIGLPLGELDAFLPPRDYGGLGAVGVFNGQQRLEENEWLQDYEAAVELAQQQNRPIFVDFTGYTCTNCRWMEANIFSLQEVKDLFSEFVLVRLYTDGGQPEHEENLRFEQERFGTIALPLYVIISPQDEVIDAFAGLTRDRETFIAFLQGGLLSQQTTKVRGLAPGSEPAGVRPGPTASFNPADSL